MALNSTYMSLKQWNLGTDFFSYVDLSNNFGKIDLHDHSTGKGVQIPTAGIANDAITQSKISPGAVGNSQIGAGAVGTSQVQNAAITNTKLAGSPSLVSGSLVWNGTGFAGTTPLIVPPATGNLATDTANILATIVAASAAKTTAAIYSQGARYVCNVDITGLPHVKIIGDAVLHNPVSGDDALALYDCPDAEVSGLWVQGAAGTRDGIHLERCPRAVVKVRCRGAGRAGVYAEECIGIDIDSDVGIDVASPYPSGVTNCTAGVVLTWDGVNLDSGCNQFTLNGFYVIGKDRGWAVDIQYAEGGVVGSVIPELSKGGIRMVKCQNVNLLGYYGEANPSDVEYTAGTCAVTNGNATATGTSTLWNTNDGESNKNAMVGKFLIIGTTWRQIQSISSDTSVTLESTWPGSTASGQAYRMQAVDLYMKQCTDCIVSCGRGGSAVLLESSSRNILNLLCESIFLDSASHNNKGRIITNRASGSSNRLVNAGNNNNFAQFSWQTDALVRDDYGLLARSQTWSGANTFTGLMTLDGQAANSVAFVAKASTNSANAFAIRNSGTLEVGDGTNARVTKLNYVSDGVWQIQDALKFTARAAASIPNNTIFLDSTDNTFKKRNNAGVVSTIGSGESINIDTPQGSINRAFAVATANPFTSGVLKDRFIIENNQDTSEIDIDFRNCSVNFGDIDSSISGTAQALFMTPTGSDYANPIQVFQKGYGPSSGRQVFRVDENGRLVMNPKGLATRALEIGSATEAQPVFHILGSDGALLWGPGGSTVADTTLARTAVNTLTASGPMKARSLAVTEAAAPTAVADQVQIFAQDDGSGKTQLMARFGTGSAVQIAIEP